MLGLLSFIIRCLLSACCVPGSRLNCCLVGLPLLLNVDRKERLHPQPHTTPPPFKEVLNPQERASLKAGSMGSPQSHRAPWKATCPWAGHT